MIRDLITKKVYDTTEKLNSSKKTRAVICLHSKEAEKLGIPFSDYRDRYISCCEKKGFLPVVLFTFAGDGKIQQGNIKDKIIELVNGDMIDSVIFNNYAVLDAEEEGRKNLLLGLEKKGIQVKKVEVERN